MTRHHLARRDAWWRSSETLAATCCPARAASADGGASPCPTARDDRRRSPPMTDADLRHARLARPRLAAGRRIDREFAGWTFHGTSLGLPSWLERLTWKTFAKAFVRDPDGTVRAGTCAASSRPAALAAADPTACR
jgi:hypothetical protein